MLSEAIRPYSPRVVQDVSRKSKAAKMESFGQDGSTLYYCTEYISPQHADDDTSWGITIQLEKNCRVDEFNFALTEWGIYFVTEPNTIL